MAVGNEDGSIEIIRTKTLKILLIIKSYSKLIQCLTWRSAATEDISSYILAAASNENDVHIFNLTEEVKSSEERSEEKTAKLLTKPSVVLSGHHTRVIQVSWSPHEPSKLASISYDGTAQVFL